ncbi:MAG: hypothetical protein ACYTEO_07005, partial [Planctomycetota bacterium]
CDESYGLIPESIINHIEQCQECREQINQLKAALSQAESPESEQREVHSSVTTMLKLHFAYIGKPVTCNIAKPFLPSLLDPALEIRIPTPIITHLHKCQQCVEDLDAIRCLNLNRKQLCRLSQLFADKPAKYNVSCQQAYAAVLTVLPMDFRETTDEVLKHVCLCPYCRKLLYEYREGIRKKYLHEGRDQQFPCEEVSVTDVFDYVVPYGLDPASDQYVKFRKSFTSHAATCPNCLATMQQLHKTIYNIAERAESDVVTVYQIDESAKTGARSEPDDIYAGFPIRVETATREGEVNAERSASTIAFGAALKQKVSAMNLKSLAKTAVAAAALILIAVGLFMSTQTAKAVTIGEIYKALVKVKNVHISKFDDKKELIQERWVSRTLDIYMIKTGKELVLSDIPNGVRESKQLGTAVTETRPLTRDDATDIEKKMSGSLGLMPFYDILKKAPPDSEWSPVTDDVLESASEGTEVYDLTWVKEEYVGFVVFRKWRFFVDPQNKRPQKTEFYEKSPDDSEYALVFRIVVEYLSDSEIRTVVKDFGF